MDATTLGQKIQEHPEATGFIGLPAAPCKYGENAWQAPARLMRFLDEQAAADPLTLDKFTLLAGTDPSYNNFCDLDRLLQTTTHIAAGFDVNFQYVPAIAVAVKHGNACGASVGDDHVTVLQKVVMGDPRAIFGGLVMVNFPIGEIEAEVLLSYGTAGGRRLLDGIVAPDFSPEAVSMLSRKKDKCRFLQNSALARLSQNSLDARLRFRYVRGGWLEQPNYTYIFSFNHPNLEINGVLSQQEMTDLVLGWAINATSNSNTITLTKDGMLIGNGTGQQDRVSAAELAIRKTVDAHHTTFKAVAISDSFFPFTDGPERLCVAGVSAILTTSSSVADEKVRETIMNRGVALAWLPDADGRGFYGH
ncbi:MAG: hypothetical protein ACOYUK_04455 [Patescibacteria group bacterium]